MYENYKEKFAKSMASSAVCLLLMSGNNFGAEVLEAQSSYSVQEAKKVMRQITRNKEIIDKASFEQHFIPYLIENSHKLLVSTPDLIDTSIELAQAVSSLQLEDLTNLKKQRVEEEKQRKEREHQQRIRAEEMEIAVSGQEIERKRNEAKKNAASILPITTNPPSISIPSHSRDDSERGVARAEMRQNRNYRK